MRSYEEALSRYGELLDAGQKKQIRKRAQQLSTQHAEQRRQIESGAKQGLKQMNDSLSAYGLANNLQRQPSSGIDERVRQMPEMHQNLRKLEAAETAQLDPYARQQAQNTINARIAEQRKRSYDMVRDIDPLTGEQRRTASGKLKWRAKTQADWDAERAAKAKEEQAKATTTSLPPAMQSAHMMQNLINGGTVGQFNPSGAAGELVNQVRKVSNSVSLDGTVAAQLISQKEKLDAMDRVKAVASTIGKFHTLVNNDLPTFSSKEDVNKRYAEVQKAAGDLIDYCESIYVISKAQADGMRNSVQMGRTDYGVLKDYLMERISLDYARDVERNAKQWNDIVMSGKGVGMNTPAGKAVTEAYRVAMESGKTEDFEKVTTAFINYANQSSDTRYQTASGLLNECRQAGMSEEDLNRAQRAFIAGDEATYFDIVTQFTKENAVTLTTASLAQSGILTEEQAKEAQDLIDSGDLEGALTYIRDASEDYAAGVMKEQYTEMWNTVLGSSFYSRLLKNGGKKTDDNSTRNSAFFNAKFYYENALENNDIEHWEAFANAFEKLVSADEMANTVTLGLALGEADRGGLTGKEREEAWAAWHDGDYEKLNSIIGDATYIGGIVGYDALHLRNQQLEDIAGISIGDFYQYEGISDEDIADEIASLEKQLDDLDPGSAWWSNEELREKTDPIINKMETLRGVQAVRRVDKNAERLQEFYALDDESFEELGNGIFDRMDNLVAKAGLDTWNNEAEFIAQANMDRYGTRAYDAKTLCGMSRSFTNQEDRDEWDRLTSDLMIYKACESQKWQAQRELEHQEKVDALLDTPEFQAFREKGFSYDELVDSAHFEERKNIFGNTIYRVEKTVLGETFLADATNEQATAMLFAQCIDMDDTQFDHWAYGSTNFDIEYMVDKETGQFLLDENGKMIPKSWTYTPTIVQGQVSKQMAADLTDLRTNMSPVEKEIFKYKCSQGLDAAVEYMDFLKPYINERKMNGVEELANDLADAAPVYSHCLTYALKPLESVGGMYTLYQTIRGEDVDQNSGWFFFTVFDNTIRQNHYEDFRNTLKESLGDGLASAGVFAFQTLDSIVDSYVNASIGNVVTGGASGWTELVSLPLMGFSAAAETEKEMLDKGIPQEMAGKVALMAGAFEAIFEVASLEQILHGADNLELGKAVRMLIGGGIEGSEEFFTEIANMGAQAAILTGHDQWSADVQSLMIDKGYEEKTAQAKATLSAVEKLALASAGGILSGGFTAFVNNTRVDVQIAEAGKQIKSQDGRLQQIIDQVLAYGDEKLVGAAKSLQERFQNNVNISNMEVGKFNYAVCKMTAMQIGESINKAIDDGRLTVKQGVQAKEAVEAMTDAMALDPTLAQNGMTADDFFSIIPDIDDASFKAISDVIFGDLGKDQQRDNATLPPLETVEKMKDQQSAKDRRKKKRLDRKAREEQLRQQQEEQMAKVNEIAQRTAEVALNTEDVATDTNVGDKLTPAQKEVADLLAEVRNAGLAEEADSLGDAIAQATAVADTITTDSPYLNAVIGATQNATEEVIKKAKANDAITKLRNDIKDLKQQLKDYKAQLKESKKETKEAWRIGEKVLRLTEKEAQQRLKELEKQFNKELKSAVGWYDKELRRAVAEAKRDMSIAERTKFEERQAKAKEKAELKKYTKKVYDALSTIASELLNPNEKNNGHIASFLQESFKDVLDSIEINESGVVQSFNLKDISMLDFLNKVKKFVTDAPTKFDTDRDTAYIELYKQLLQQVEPQMESFEGYIDWLSADGVDADKITLKNLDSKGMKTLYNALTILMNFSTNVNKTYSGLRAKTISETNATLRDDYQKMNAHHMGDNEFQRRLRGFLFADNANMYTIMNLSGSTMQEIYHKIHEGWNRRSFLHKENRKFFDGLYEKYDFDWRDRGNWRSEVKSYKLDSGETLHFTDAQLMYLFAQTFNEDGLRHILGGIGVDGASADANISRDHIFSITENDIDNLCSQLSKTQKNIVLDMLNDSATRQRLLCNEVSQKKFLVDMFNVENYMPIKTAARVKETSMPSKNNTVNATSNASATKARIRGANPLLMSDIFDVYGNYVNWVAQYNSLGLVMEDALRVANYIPIAEDGTVLYNQSNAHYINDMMGKASGTDFLENLIRDITGTQERARSTSFDLNKLAGNFRKAKIALKASVMMKQLTAIPRACVYIPVQDFVSTQHFNVKKNIAEMQEHSGTALWKSSGNFEIGLGRSSLNLVLGEDTAYGKYSEASMAGAAKADDIGWSWIWAAAKNNVGRTTNLQYGSDEYWAKVVDVFETAVTNTQVSDSPLCRTQFMRSQDQLRKQTASFMSEPQIMLNMLMTAIGKKDPKLLAKTVIFTCVAQALEAAITTGTRWVKKYGEDAEEQYFDYFLDQFKSNVNPLNQIVGISQIMSLVEGYDVERQDLVSIKDAIKGYNELADFINGKSGRMTGYKVAKDVITPIFDIFGLPADGMFQYLDSVFKVTNLAFGTNIHEYNPSLSNVKTQRDEFGRIVKSARQGKLEYIQGLITKGENQRAVDSYIKQLGEQDEIRFETAREYGLSAKDYITASLNHETMDDKEYAKWLIENSGYSERQRDAIYRMFEGKDRDLGSYARYDISSNDNAYAAFNWATERGVKEEDYYKWFLEKKAKVDNQFGGEATAKKKDVIGAIEQAVRKGELSANHAGIIQQALFNDEQARDYTSHTAFEMSATDSSDLKYDYLHGKGVDDSTISYFNNYHNEKVKNAIGGEVSAHSKEEFANEVMARVKDYDKRVAVYTAWYPNESEANMPNFTNQQMYEAKRDLTPTRYNRVVELNLTESEIKLLLDENAWYNEKKKSGTTPKEKEWKRYFRETKSKYGVKDEGAVVAIMQSNTKYAKYRAAHNR